MFFVFYFLLYLQDSTSVSSAEIVNPDQSPHNIGKLRIYLNQISSTKTLNDEQKNLVVELINKCQQINACQENFGVKLTQQAQILAIKMISLENLLVPCTRSEWKKFFSPIDDSFEDVFKSKEDHVKQVEEFEELVKKDKMKTIFSESERHKIQCFLSEIRTDCQMADINIEKSYEIFNDFIVLFGSEESGSSVTNPPTLND